MTYSGNWLSLVEPFLLASWHNMPSEEERGKTAIIILKLWHFLLLQFSRYVTKNPFSRMAEWHTNRPSTYELAACLYFIFFSLLPPKGGKQA